MIPDGATGRPAVTSPGDAGAADGGERCLTVREVDAIVQRLFAVGMSLAPAAAALEDRARARTVEAIDELDEVVRELRLAVFDRLMSAAREGGESGHLGGETEAPVSLGLTALRLDGAATTTVAYEDAVRALCRADVAVPEARTTAPC